MEQVHGVAAAFQCNFGELPFLYLGLPVGYNPRSARLWKPVIEKIEGRLSSWKGKLLSIGGRLTLLKAVLDAVPVYYLSLFKAPKCIISKIDGIRRQFLWGSKDGEKKICWVSWDKITLEKSKGGLGLKNLSDFNTSLIGKWAWRWKTEDSALWVQVIRAIYGESGGFGSDHFRRKNTVWSYIIGCCHDAKSIGIDIVGAIKRRVVTGFSTNFWADSWVSGVPSLKELYPRLFALELEKNCRVADRRLWHEDKWIFSWQWRCQPRGRAAEALKGLETLLSNLEPIHGSGDSWYWSLDNKGEYSVKGLYKILSTHRNSSFGWRSMFSWNSWIPIKVNVMAWKACSNKLPTLDNLSKRGVRYNQNLCPFGCGVLESIDHTLCHCVNVEAVWKKVFSWWKLSFPSSFSWHFICSLLGKYSFASLSDRAFHGVCCVVIWLLWNRRNRLVFGEAGSTHRILEEDIFPCIQSKSLSWIKYRSKVCVGSWSNWVLNPMEAVL